MVLYNLTNFTNATGIGDIIMSANNFSGGVSGSPMLFGLMLVVVFFVVLVALKRYEFKDSLLAASFVGFILGGFLWALGAINPLIEFGFLFLLGIGFLWHIFDTST